MCCQPDSINAAAIVLNKSIVKFIDAHIRRKTIGKRPRVALVVSGNQPVNHADILMVSSLLHIFNRCPVARREMLKYSQV